MTQLLKSLSQIADRFDAIILDQWGVLHDGSTPYAGAIEALEYLKADGARLAVLSNSGKRADLNTARIADKGFVPELFDCVMTSGEALWQDARSGIFPGKNAYVIAANPRDAGTWAIGLNLTFVTEMSKAEFVLIMGLPEGDTALSADALAALKAEVLLHDLPVYCSNPDRASPRAAGKLVVSPGALAHDIADAGGKVTFYGKPYAPVFRAVEAVMCVAPERCLMVGDSLEHDIAGAANAGWSTAFIRGGIHARVFESGEIEGNLDTLLRSRSTIAPEFSLQSLR